MNGTILVVDDDTSMCELLATQLEEAGWRPLTAQRADEALAVLDRETIDVVLTDLRMPGTSGTELCREVVRTRPDVPVVVMTGFGSVENAISAIRAGAYDFVTKPFEFDALQVLLERAASHRRLREEVWRLRRTSGDVPGYEGMIGTSGAMQRVYELVDRLAASEASVLIVGESGTGKELLARALHRRSRRASGSFVGINCAAVPEQLLESELFGHEKGAFTDARSSRPGLLRQADGGTLFLDEIGDMSTAVQPKLLRALQERVIRPVGSDTEVSIDVRVISATNRDMRSAVESGEFRADLFYRLAVVTIDLPPLRKRGDDVLLLAEHFCEQVVAASGRRPVDISPAAAKLLRAYGWPGNVRELHNAIEHALALCPSDEILPEHLPMPLQDAVSEPGVAYEEPASSDGADFLPLFEVERRHILRVLEAVHGNKSRAARILGIDRKTLHARLQRYGQE